MTAQRSHEFLLDGDAATMSRLGFSYTEGQMYATFYRPDSQYSEQESKVPYDDLAALAKFLTEVLPIMKEAQQS